MVTLVPVHSFLGANPELTLAIIMDVQEAVGTQNAGKAYKIMATDMFRQKVEELSQRLKQYRVHIQVSDGSPLFKVTSLTGYNEPVTDERVQRELVDIACQMRSFLRDVCNSYHFVSVTRTVDVTELRTI